MEHPDPSQRPAAPSFRALAQGVVESATPGDRDAARLRRVVEGVLVPFFRGRRLDGLDARDVERLVEAHARAGLATKRRILHALGVLLVRAVELGHVRGSPSRARRKLRDLSTPLPLASAREQAAFVAALAPPHRTLFETALESGARLWELLRVPWDDVDLRTRSLLIRRDDGRPRVLPLSAGLCETFGAAAVGSATDAPVFADARDEEGALRFSWRLAFRRAACAVDCPMLRIADLRQLAAIRMVGNGVDLSTVQVRMGYPDVLSVLRCAAHLEQGSHRPQRHLRREA